MRGAVVNDHHALTHAVSAVRTVSAVARILVAVVFTIAVTVTQPVRMDAAPTAARTRHEAHVAHERRYKHRVQALANVSRTMQVYVELDYRSGENRVRVKVNMTGSCPNSIDVDRYAFALHPPSIHCAPKRPPFSYD